MKSINWTSIIKFAGIGLIAAATTIYGEKEKEKQIKEIGEEIKKEIMSELNKE